MMQWDAYGLTAVIGTVMGTLIVFVPVLGFTARYALKPLVESLAQAFQSRESEQSVRILERRMALLEQHLEAMDTTMTRLAEAAEFHRDLHSGGRAQLPGAPTDTGGSHGPPGDRRS